MVLKEALVAMTVSGVIRLADAWPDDLQIRSESDLKPFPGARDDPTSTRTPYGPGPNGLPASGASYRRFLPRHPVSERRLRFRERRA